MQVTNGARRRVAGLHRYSPTTYLVLLGVVASFVLFLFAQRWEEESQRIKFESWAQTYASSVESTLAQYVGALQFICDVFEISSSPVTRRQFTRHVSNILPRYPGIQAFGWDPLVRDNERAALEAAAREEGFHEFEFTERAASGKVVRAARRDEYVVVYYIHPLENNEQAFGFDIASDATRLKAITRAFRTGELVATARITLVQEPGNQYGLLLLLPIYRQGTTLHTAEDRWNSRRGFVVEVLRIGDAVEAALGGLSDAGIHITLHDMSAEEGDRLLYHRGSGAPTPTDKPLPEADIQEGLFWSHTFNFADRQWRLAMAPSEAFHISRSAWQAWTVLFGSLLLTALSTFLMQRERLHTVEVEQRIEQQAQTNQQLTAEIRERNRAEAERDKNILNLEAALNEVDTLRGILPICSFCKKVRDDGGYWEQVEVYISKHSRADFSHGVCPECFAQHYADITTDLPPDQ